MRDCLYEVRFSAAANGVNARCNLCGQLHRFYGTKWFKAEDYEIGKYDIQKALKKDTDGDYGHNPQYAPWETPAHEPDCGFKDFDLLGLTRRARKTIAGPGVVKVGVAMVDRQNMVRHWCRPKKDA